MMVEDLDLRAREQAEDFARELVDVLRPSFEPALLGAYLIGSLAHGGFSRRYSDIDVAFITENGLSPSRLNEIKQVAATQSADLAPKLSIFWTDRSLTLGRLPVLDRLDLLDHGRAIYEREKIAPRRPGITEVRGYLAGRPYESWVERAREFVNMSVLAPADRKAYLRALLYPARFCYSWSEGKIGSNDEAVQFLKDTKPFGLDLDLIERALRCRQAAADPDELFHERSRLTRQIDVCSDMIMRTNCERVLK
jgi:predicted nucleotidyltransferase